MYKISVSTSVILVLKEEKVVIQLVYSSFTRVAASSVRWFSISTTRGSQNHSSSVQIRSDYDFTSY